MDAKEIKMLLDHAGSRIVAKFVRDQQSLIDTFRAEVTRSLDTLYSVLVKKLGNPDGTAKNGGPTEAVSQPEA